MDDIDATLLRLRDLPLDPRLAAIDGAVLEGLAASKAQARMSTAGLAVVTGLSLMVGLVGSLIPSAAPRPASDAITPLVAASALAPSELLSPSKLLASAQ